MEGERKKRTKRKGVRRLLGPSILFPPLPSPCGPRPFLSPFKPPLHSSGTRGPWSAEAYEEGVVKATSGPTFVTFAEEVVPDSTEDWGEGKPVAREGSPWLTGLLQR